MSSMLAWLRARSLPQPSLVVDDFNGLHLLHMHPHGKACCRPWMDSAASDGEADCWRNLARRNRKQNQTIYCADFRGYLSLEQSIGTDAKAYRDAFGSQVRLVAMSSHLICEKRFRREYRSWLSASQDQRQVGCVAWLHRRASSRDAPDPVSFCAASSFTGQGSASLAARVAQAAAAHDLALLDAFRMSATGNACPEKTKDGRHYPGLVPLEAARLQDIAAACRAYPTVDGRLESLTAEDVRQGCMTVVRA